jgi:hypothetical protein
LQNCQWFIAAGFCTAGVAIVFLTVALGCHAGALATTATGLVVVGCRRFRCRRRGVSGCRAFSGSSGRLRRGSVGRGYRCGPRGHRGGRGRPSVRRRRSDSAIVFPNCLRCAYFAVYSQAPLATPAIWAPIPAERYFYLPRLVSSRRQMDSPGEPIASNPRLAGSGVGALRVAGSTGAMLSISSGPLVLPVMIALPEIVS